MRFQSTQISLVCLGDLEEVSVRLEGVFSQVCLWLRNCNNRYTIFSTSTWVLQKDVTGLAGSRAHELDSLDVGVSEGCS